MPTVSEYDVFKSASPAVQENMTYYFNQSASLRSWSAVSVEGSASLSPVFGEIFGEGQGKNFTYLTYLYMFKKQYPACKQRCLSGMASFAIVIRMACQSLRWFVYIPDRVGPKKS